LTAFLYSSHELYNLDGVIVTAFNEELPANRSMGSDLTTLGYVPDGYAGSALIYAD